MKAVAKLRKEQGLDVIESSPDQVTDEQVLLRMHSASICGSDVGFYDFTPAYEKFARIPVIMGHEFSGEIAEVGNHVSDFNKGDRVCCESVIYCGKCRFCRIGMTNICKNFLVFGMHRNGGFSEYVTVDQRFLHRLPDEVGFLEGGIVEPLSVVVNALDDVAKQKAWQNALVLGPGPLGMLSAELLRARGVPQIVVVGVDADSVRLGIAESLGFGAVNSTERSLDDLIGKTPGGDGFDLAIVAAGAPAAARSALSATVKGGQIIILGIFTQEVSLPLSDTVRREIGMSGSYASRWPHYERAISLLKEKQIRADRIVTHRFKLDEAKQAFETAKSKAGCKIEFYA